MIPPAKTTMIRSLRLSEIWSSHTKGIGSSNMVRSLIRLMMQSARKMLDSVVIHLPGMLTSQALWIGLHLKTLIKKAGR